MSFVAHPKPLNVPSPGGTGLVCRIGSSAGNGRSALFPISGTALIMNSMQRTGLQFSLLSMIGLVACVAINLWLFQWHVFAGIVGLNVTKHVLIAYLCQVMGVDKRRHTGRVTNPTAPPSPALPFTSTNP